MAQFEFIQHDISAEHGSSKNRRQARSHAARSGHARLRRLRMQQYQAELAEQERAGHTTSGPGSEDGSGSCSSDSTGTTTPSQPNSTIVSAYVYGQTPSPTATSVVHCGRRDPFLSYQHAFAPLENFLFQHYMCTVIPYISAHCTSMAPPSGSNDCHLVSVTTDWVRIAVMDADFRDAIYLAACRHLWKNQYQPEYFDELSTRYKIRCMRALNQEIGRAAPITATIVAKVIMLAWDDLSVADPDAASHHMRGALKMLDITTRPHVDAPHIKAFLIEALHEVNSRPQKPGMAKDMTQPV